MPINKIFTSKRKKLPTQDTQKKILSKKLSTRRLASRIYFTSKVVYIASWKMSSLHRRIFERATLRCGRQPPSRSLRKITERQSNDGNYFNYWLYDISSVFLFLKLDRDSSDHTLLQGFGHFYNLHCALLVNHLQYFLDCVLNHFSHLSFWLPDWAQGVLFHFFIVLIFLFELLNFRLVSSVEASYFLITFFDSRL